MLLFALVCILVRPFSSKILYVRHHFYSNPISAPLCVKFLRVYGINCIIALCPSIKSSTKLQGKSYNKDPFPDREQFLEKSPNLQFSARSDHRSSSACVSLQAHKSSQGSGMIKVNSSRSAIIPSSIFGANHRQ